MFVRRFQSSLSIKKSADICPVDDQEEEEEHDDLDGHDPDDNDHEADDD